MNQNYTSTLYAEPSPLDGIANIMDLTNTGTEYNTSDSPEEADTEAIASDWMKVGEEISKAILRLRSELIR